MPDTWESSSSQVRAVADQPPHVEDHTPAAQGMGPRTQTGTQMAFREGQLTDKAFTAATTRSQPQEAA